MPENSELDVLYSRVLLALCAWREARGQGRDGMRAVCWSVRNRVTATPARWWGSSYPAVILKAFQYSSFNADDPNSKILPGPPSVNADWLDALEVADEVYYGHSQDPTYGATHYYATSIDPPQWTKAPKTVFTVQIGVHRFYVAS